MTTRPSYAQHGVYRWSGLARVIDPAVPSNRALLIIATLASLLAFAWGLASGVAWANAGTAAIALGLVVVVTWALTRELVPGVPLAAFLAVALCLMGWFRFGDQSLLLPAGILAAVRVVNRSTGKAAETVDSVSVTLLFGWIAWTVSWSFALVGGVALVLDAVLPPVGGQPSRRRHLPLGVTAVLLGGASALSSPGTIDAGVGMPTDLPPFPGGWLWAVTLAALGFVAAWRQRSAHPVGDVDGLPLLPARVRVGSALGVLGVSLAMLEGGVEPSTLCAGQAAVVALVLATIVGGVTEQSEPQPGSPICIGDRSMAKGKLLHPGDRDPLLRVGQRVLLRRAWDLHIGPQRAAEGLPMAERGFGRSTCARGGETGMGGGRTTRTPAYRPRLRNGLGRAQRRVATPGGHRFPGGQMPHCDEGLATD